MGYIVLFVYIVNIISAERYAPRSVNNNHNDFDFVANEPTLQRVERHTENSGFHRDLVTEVIIPFAKLENPVICSMVLVETIPPGMYLDVYQIIGNTQWGGPQVLSYKEFDVEKPEDQSTAQQVFVYSRLKYLNGALKAMTRLPVHLRYHKPLSENSYVKVSLGIPDILIRCSDGNICHMLGEPYEAPCDVKNESQCLWTKVEFSKKPDPLQFEIPVGKLEHSNFVIGTTLTVTVIGTLVICFVIIQKSDINMHNKKK